MDAMSLIVGIVIGMVIAVFVVIAIAASRAGSVGGAFQVLTVAGFTTGMVLGLFVLGSMARPVPSGPALAGVVAGFAVVCVVWWFGLLAWPWFAPVGTLTTVAVALLVSEIVKAHGQPRDGRA